MAYEDTINDLNDWFEDRDFHYLLFNEYETLSGKHYVFHSEEIKGKSISVEMFANRYDGLHSSICELNNGKVLGDTLCFNISENEGIKSWDKCLSFLENNLEKQLPKKDFDNEQEL